MLTIKARFLAGVIHSCRLYWSLSIHSTYIGSSSFLQFCCKSSHPCIQHRLNGRFFCLCSFQEEIETLIHRLSSLNQQPVYFSKYTLTSISNVIALHLFGLQYVHDDPVRLELDKSLEMSGKSQSSGSLVVFFPEWMYRIAGLLPFTRIYAVKTSLRNLLKYIR